MASPFRNYDAWLEAPFQRMCDEQEAAEAAVEKAIEAGDLPEDPTEDEIEAYLEELAAAEADVDAYDDPE